MIQDVFRGCCYICGVVFGWVWFHFAPTIPFHAVALLFIVSDAWTAYKLDKRVHSKYPEATAATGRFTSFLFGKVIRETIPERLWAIILAWTAEHWIFINIDCSLVYIVTGVIIVEQSVSMLENATSCREGNDGLFFRILKKILVDKTARHLGDDVAALLDKKENEDNSK